MKRTISKQYIAWTLLWLFHVALSTELGHLHERSNKLSRHRRSKGISKHWPARDVSAQHFKNANRRFDSRHFTNDRFRRNRVFRDQFYHEQNSYPDYFDLSRFRASKHLREARSLKSNEIAGNDFPPISRDFSPEFDVFEATNSLSHNNVELPSVDVGAAKNADIVQYSSEDVVTSSLATRRDLNLDPDQASANGIDIGDRNGTRQQTEVSVMSALPLGEGSNRVIDCHDVTALGKLLRDIAGRRQIDSLTMDEVLTHRLVASDAQLVRCFKKLSSGRHIRRGAPVKRYSGEPPMSWANLLKSMTPSTTPTPPKKRGRPRGNKKRNRKMEPLFDGSETISSMPAGSMEGGVGEAKTLVTLYNQLGGASLQILPGGVVRGTRSVDVYCVFRITYVDSIHGLIAKIKGEKSKLYLAMRDNGSLYVTADLADRNTSFRHDKLPLYDAFRSEPHGSYVALNYKGRLAKKMFKSTLSKATHFLGLPPAHKLIEALSDGTVSSSPASSNGKKCKKGSKCQRENKKGGKSKRKKRKRKKKKKKKCRSKKCRARKRNRKRGKNRKRTSRSVSKSDSRAPTDGGAESNDFKSRRRLGRRTRKRRKFRNFSDKNFKKLPPADASYHTT